MRILNIIVGLIIGIAFASGGVFIALETSVPTYQSWQAMKSWQSTPATLIKVNGLENDTEATYRYMVSGVAHINDRVYGSTFKDNIGSYHQDLYQELQWLKDNYQPVTIWYNPDNPEQAVIDRDMRWGLFALMTGFCSVFILIGLVVSYVCIRPSKEKLTKPNKPSVFELRKQWKQYQVDNNTTESFVEFLQQRFHELKQQTEVEPVKYSETDSQPWLNKKEWRSHRIRSGAKTSMYFMWFFAIVWNAISSPLLFVLDDEIKDGNYAALIGLLFPLVGLFLIRQAWKMTREWQRFGVIELEMDPFPGSIGGHVGGSLLVKNIYDFNAKFKVELECVYSYMSGSGDDRSRRENIKWAEGGDAKVVAGGNGVRIKFRFDIPENLPESDNVQSGDYYFWRFKVSADLKGTDLKREYNIPVYKTQLHSKTIRHDVTAQVEEIREKKAIETLAAVNSGNFASTALARSLRYKNKGSKQIFYYPMFRNKVLTLFALIFGGGFGFAAISINGGLGEGGIMGIGMLLFSLPFALVGLFASIAAIYLPLNNLTVTLEGRSIKALRRLFIFPIKYNVLQGNDIRKMEVKSTGSTGQGVKKIKHYKVIAHTTTFKKVTIAEDIDGEDLANQLKEFLCKRLLVSC